MDLLTSAAGHRRRQQGNALFVALILLLLASVITLLSLRVGIFEQRTSGNDMRAKLVAQLAEAGVAQGAEFFRLNPDALADESGNWARCDADDTTFPCGSIPRTSMVDHDGDASTAPQAMARRGTMYYWAGGSSPGDVNGDGNSNDHFDRRMLPLASVIPAAGRIESVGSFDDVAYGVGVVICRVANNSGSAVRCATTEDEWSNTLVYNFVSVASLPGESARSTVSQMLGQYRIFNPDTNKPPIVASGNVDLTGGLQIVTNPNAGGNGVPVSVWTRKDVQKTGTPNTCYYDEFIRYGGGTTEWRGTETKILACDDCNCATDKLLSYVSSGVMQEEGIDILDVDNNTVATPITGQANFDVKETEFPCDMFSFVFGVRARKDTNGDNFCDTRLDKISYTNSEGVTAMMNVDEAFLYDNATYIVNPRADGASLDGHTAPWTTLATEAQLTHPATYPAEAFSGIVWCQQSCNIQATTSASGKLGTPDKPVLLVVDGDLSVKGRIYGLVLLRAIDEGPLTAASGGSARLKLEGNAAIYGSVVIQGSVEHAAGTAAVIFNGDVFQALSNSIPSKDSNLPGAWTDRLSY